MKRTVLFVFLSAFFFSFVGCGSFNRQPAEKSGDARLAKADDQHQKLIGLLQASLQMAKNPDPTDSTIPVCREVRRFWRIQDILFWTSPEHSVPSPVTPQEIGLKDQEEAMKLGREIGVKAIKAMAPIATKKTKGICQPLLGESTISHPLDLADKDAVVEEITGIMELTGLTISDETITHDQYRNLLRIRVRYLLDQWRHGKSSDSDGGGVAVYLMYDAGFIPSEVGITEAELKKLSPYLKKE